VKLKLYYFPLSVHAQKVIIAFDETGVDYEKCSVNLMDPSVADEYQKINPIGITPFLRDEARGQDVGDSSTIVEYVELYHPGHARSVPSDPAAAIPVRFFDRVFDLFFTEKALKIAQDQLRPADASDSYGIEQTRRSLDFLYGFLDTHLKDKTWIAGGAFSLADAASAASLGLLQRMQPFDAHEHIVAYFGRLAERPSVRAVLQEAETFLAAR
jgi:glutathione S-transferase